MWIDQNGSDSMAIESVTPTRLSVISVQVFKNEFISINIGAPIDEDLVLRIEPPDQVPAPVIVVEHWPR